MAVKRDEIRLSDDDLQMLEHKCSEYGMMAESYRGNWAQLHDDYWRAYLAKPEQAIKEFPWPRANNYVAPMVTVAVDTLRSMFYDAMLASKPRVLGGSDDPASDFTRADAEKLDEYYFKFLYDKQLSLPYLGDDWNLHNLVDGTSVVSAHWRKDRIIKREDDIQVRAKTKTETTEVLGQTVRAEIPDGFETDVTERSLIDYQQGPEVQIHDMERIYIAPGTKSALAPGGGLQYSACPWYYEERVVSEGQIHQMAFAGHTVLQDQEIRGNLIGEVDLTEREYTQADEETIAPELGPSAICRVYYMRWVMPGEYILPNGDTHTQGFDEPGGYPEEIVVWYWPKIKRISRIVPLSRIRPDNKRPGIDNRYCRVGSFWYGLGVPAKIMQTNKLYTSALRQMIDYGTLQNKPFAFYEPATTGLLPAMQSIQPGSMIPVASARGVQIPRFQGNHQFWQVVENVAQQWMERLTSVTDFTVGRSPSVPNAPRTFRGQSQMLQQANISFSHAVALMAVSYLELFRSIHTLHRRHAPAELEFEFFDKSSGLLTQQTVPRRLFKAGIDFSFELNPNRMQEQQAAQQRLALIQNMPFLSQDPEALRNAMSDVYAAEGKIDDFNTRIWPQEKIDVMNQQMQMQQQGMQAGMAPPQQPQPMAGPRPLEQEYQPVDTEETEEDINVAI